jgi:NitT/TauT family transport system substrate-binding protein
MEASSGCTRRNLLLALLAMGAAATGLPGCSGPNPRALRVASNTFPGYEFLHAAAELGFLDPAQGKMIRMGSATSCLHGLAAGILEGACLTLDEVITALADRLPLRIVAVLDVSLGADMVVARPGISALADLRGKRVGSEQTAVGALMLHAALKMSNLRVEDVELVYTTVDQHQAFYEQGLVDALVTFEPVASQLLAADAVKLVDSAEIPFRIVDVLAVTPDAFEHRPESVKAFIQAHFDTIDKMVAHDQPVRASLARGLGVPAAELDSIYRGLHLLSREDNREWFADGGAQLAQAANDLQDIMLEANLVSERVAVDESIAPLFLSE